MQENLPEDETPPAWMWFCDEEIEIHFNTVAQKRKDKYTDTTTADEEQPDMIQNDLAAAWRQ